MLPPRPIAEHGSVDPRATIITGESLIITILHFMFLHYYRLYTLYFYVCFSFDFCVVCVCCYGVSINDDDDDDKYILLTYFSTGTVFSNWTKIVLVGLGADSKVAIMNTAVLAFPTNHVHAQLLTFGICHYVNILVTWSHRHSIIVAVNQCLLRQWQHNKVKNKIQHEAQLLLW